MNLETPALSLVLPDWLPWAMGIVAGINAYIVIGALVQAANRRFQWGFPDNGGALVLWPVVVAVIVGLSIGWLLTLSGRSVASFIDSKAPLQEAPVEPPVERRIRPRAATLPQAIDEGPETKVPSLPDEIKGDMTVNEVRAKAGLEPLPTAAPAPAPAPAPDLKSLHEIAENLAKIKALNESSKVAAKVAAEAGPPPAQAPATVGMGTFADSPLHWEQLAMQDASVVYDWRVSPFAGSSDPMTASGTACCSYPTPPPEKRELSLGETLLINGGGFAGRAAEFLRWKDPATKQVAVVRTLDTSYVTDVFIGHFLHMVEA